MGDQKPRGIASFNVGFGRGPEGAGEEGDGGAARTFRVAVVSHLVPGADWSLGRRPPIEPLAIDAESFDQVMAAFSPSLAIEVEDPFDRRAPKIRVDLRLTDRKSLRPNEIVRQVPELQALSDAQRIVQDLAARKLSSEAARAQLSRIVPRPAWADALVAIRATGPAATGRPASGEEAPAVRSPAVPAVAPSDAGSLFDMVDIAAPSDAPDSVRPAPAPTPTAAPSGRFGGLVAAVARGGARAGDALSSAPAAHVDGSPLERGFHTLLSSILRHPEVRRLERAWRGLRLLVEHADKKAGVEVDVVCASPDEVEDALTRLARPEAGGAPVDLVVVDHVLEPTAADLRRFEGWCAIAAEMMAPIVLAAKPSAVGADSVEQLARSTNACSTSDDPRAVATRAVAARDPSRWAALVVNDPLVRAPYTASSGRQAQPPFEEDANDPGAQVFANGAFVVASLCAQSFARLGWPTSITGPHDGVIGDLPVHSPGGEQHPAIPVEALPSEATVAEAARAGLTMIACQGNSDAAVVLRAPVLNRAPGKPAVTTLADQLFVGRFARAVQQVAAAIPASADPKAAQQAASIVLGDLFDRAPPVGPQWTTSVDAARGVLAITIRPRRFAGVGIEEVTLEAPLAG